MYLVMVKHSTIGRRRTIYSYESLIVGETIAYGIDDDMESIAYWDVLECVKMPSKTGSREKKSLRCTVQFGERKRG